MLVEPGSLGWVAGRMVEARDGETWAVEFARFSAPGAVVRDDGSGPGKGLKPERAGRRAEGRCDDLEDMLDLLHTSRERGRALRKARGTASRAPERAEAARDKSDRMGRGGTSRSGHATATSRLWGQAERLRDQAMAAERAWKLARSAFGFLTPEGRLDDRRQAGAVVAAAPPELSGPARAETRRLLLRPESYTSLDEARRRLAEPGLDPDVLPAPRDLEGLRRQPRRLWESAAGSAATRAWARAVHLSKARGTGRSWLVGPVRPCAGSGVPAARWDASTAWRGCSRRGIAR